MAHSASLVAVAMLKKAMDQKIYVTQHQLQRMLYFAHGCHLVRHNIPLIEEQFEAWKLGPVVPQLFRIFIFYGNRKIYNTGLLQFAQNGNPVDSLGPDADCVIDDTLKVVGTLAEADWTGWIDSIVPKWAKSTDTRGIN
ncbi:MAG: DUF4065 domain-containing protein, partial [Chitinophagaceae bacterium]